MSVLSYSRLVRLVEDGVITNVEHDQINSASIDITVGRHFMRELDPKHRDTPIREKAAVSDEVILLSNREMPAMKVRDVGEFGSISIKPGEFVLAQSVQVFNLPDNISCEYKLKSSMARIGLEHLNAGWCDAGWNGSVLTLELKNMLRFHEIMVTEGDRIGQMVFFEHQPVPEDRTYAARGRYNNDPSVTGIKP
jgi:dCTP deaminase